MRDKDDRENFVVVMKTTYRLTENGTARFWAELIDDEADMALLCFQDEYRHDMHHSMVIQESDMSPFKPRCDIIINGTAHALGNQPVDSLPVSVTLLSPENQPLMNKKLVVTGERAFRRTDKKTWELTLPQPFTSLPVVWIYAFGGECRINGQDKGNDAVPEYCLLSQEARSVHPDRNNPPLAHSVYPANPIGRGYITPWYLTATQADSFPAPRIEQPDNPFTAEAFQALVNGHSNVPADVYRPAGLGITGRSWQPRLARAGTYDHSWLTQRHPYLPQDFEFSYWNAAPEDQQIAALPPGCRFILSGL
ncbi:DUF2169 family type VI secretion system accessory protein [Citrobacter rodentium]|nr:DUF2169 domain-containing protein [Citrobacter rodentium]